MGDLDIYKAQNFGHQSGLGRRAALVVVDFTVGFNDPKLFGGGNIDAAIKRTAGLLALFREQKLPVAFTRVVYADDKSDAGVFALKNPNLLMLTENHPAGQVVPELKPLPKEMIIRKTQASGFDPGLRVLRHRPRALACAAGRGHRGGSRLHHLGLRARHGGGRHAEQLPHHRRARLRGRPGDRAPQGQSVRHGPEIR